MKYKKYLVRRLWFLGLSFIYTWLLSFVYTYSISKYWAYGGFGNVSNSSQLVLLYTFVLILGMIYPTTKDARSFLLLTFFYMFIIPGLIFYFHNQKLISYLYTLILFWIIVCSVSRIKIKATRIFHIGFGNIIATIIFITLSTLVIFVAIKGVSSLSLDVINAGQNRENAWSNIPTVVGYLYSITSKIFIPLALVWSIANMRFITTLIVLMLAILLFAYTQFKGVLFSPVMVLALYWCYRNCKVDNSKISYLFIIFVTLSIIEMFILEQIDLPPAGLYTSLAMRRTLLVPVMLDYNYVQIFDDLSKYWWSHSKVGFGLVKKSYASSPGFFVGKELFGVTDLSANTGVIGSGYSNAGFLGVAVYSAIVGILISIFNEFGKKIGHALVASASFFPLLVAVNASDLPTAIISHGILVLIVLLSCIRPSIKPAPLARP